jgi:Zn-dependent M28 family amino/carboxypeptidase
MRSIFPEAPSSEEVMRRLLLLVGLLAVAIVGCMGDEEAAPTATEQTETAVTAERLTDAVTREGLRTHLEALQRIADEHDGNRSSGTPGYDASVEYVVATLQEAGYEPSVQPVRYIDSREVAPAELAQIAPDATTYAEGDDFVPLRYSGSGEADALLQPVDPDSETSGCDPSDFDAFERGSIALVRRGGCFFVVKVGNALSAGAAAVLVCNDGSPGHEHPVEATLLSPAELPALSLANDLGERLAHSEQSVRMHVNTSFDAGEVEAANVLGELPGVHQQEAALLVGAHLDSVAGGPGINDNGSGVAAVLELAKQARVLGYRPQAPIRFAFWAGEEAGLYGSKEYVESLGADADDEIVAMINLDMLGSPNAEAFVYEGDATIEEMLTESVRSEGLEPVPINLEGASDHAPFAEAGIRVGGLFSGSDEPDAKGESHDPCYHRACDRLDNIDLGTLESMADAVGAALFRLTTTLS